MKKGFQSTTLCTAIALALSAHAASAQEADGTPGAQTPVRILAQSGDAGASAVTDTEQRRYNIEGGSLDAVLDRFAVAAGIELSVSTELTRGKTSPGLSGQYSVDEGLHTLLAGSGLSYGFTGANAVILSRAAGQPSDPTTLPAVNVISYHETAIGPVNGYVAARGTAGTKTDTPLIEIPQSVSVLTRDRLDNQAVDSLAQALRYSAGVQGEAFGFNPRAASIRMRGFDVTSVGLDDLQLRTATDTGEAYNPEVYGAERIEVLRGPASVLYGQTSPGGIVNFITKRPTAEPLREVILEAGNFDRREGRLDLSGPVVEDGSLLYRLTGLVRDSDAQVDFTPDDRVYFAPALTWKPGENTTLTFLSHYQEDKTGDFIWLPPEGTLTANPNGKIPVNRNPGEPDFDHHERTQNAIGYLFEHRVEDHLTLRQNVRYAQSELDRAIVYGGGGLQADLRTLDRFAFENDKKADVLSIDNQVQWTFATGSVSHTLLAGLDYQKLNEHNVSAFDAAPSIDIFAPVYGQAMSTPAVYLDEDRALRQLGLYLQDQIKFDQKWVLSLGGRQDWADTEVVDKLTGTRSEQDDKEFTGRAGLVYLSESGWAPYVSYSESFVPVAGNDAAGSPFKPETGQQHEVGIKFQPPGANSFITLAAFDLTRQNVSEFAPPAFEQRQTGEIRSRGIELEGVASLNARLDLIGSYTYLDAEITRSEVPNQQGQRPAQTPEHMASLWADYTLDGGWGVGGGVRYLGSTYADTEPNMVSIPGVTLFDAAAHYDWEQFRFALNVHNLFDKEYVAAGFSGFTSYGAARTLKASVTYQW